MRDVKSFDGIFIHRDPVDMRRGIRGLSEIVESAQMGNWNENALFVFCGRRKNSIKILYFDKSGFALWQKLLDREKFHWPRKVTTPVVVMTSEQLSWLLEGFDVMKMRPFAELKIERLC